MYATGLIRMVSPAMATTLAALAAMPEIFTVTWPRPLWLCSRSAV